MSFKKQTMENYLMHGTEVDNLFISEYMSGAEGDAVKQYLMAYMYASCGMEKDSRALAAALGITLARVNEIWDYWESLGLVVRLPGDDEKDCCISFVNLREEVFLGKKKKEGSLPAAFTMDERDFTKLLRSIESVTGRLLENGEPEAVASWLSGFGAASEVII